ncbi:MAG TPA: carboxypeptidase-like regulatory domain-containing protein [Acidisarcina sp.]|nr:carboxypeptidase-like regulatory domain-containing protein [Acidisarcina sp.]
MEESKRSGSRSAYRTLAYIAVVLVGLGIALLPSFSSAEQQRVIQGKVFGASEEPVSGAVVYLKDVKTLGVKSFISTSDGSYRFGQLSLAVDYEIWAEQGGKKSPTRTVSSFDQKTLYTINLKLSK